jgi:heavy metal sensor kinase
MKFPIRIRLAAILCTTLLALTAILELGAYSSVRLAIDSIADRELATRLAGIVDHVSRHLGRYSWQQMDAELKARPAFQADYLTIRSESGETVYQGAAIAGIQTASGITTVDAGHRALRVLRARRLIHNLPYDLWLATDMRMASDILNRLWFLMLLSLPLLLALSALAAYWVSGRALRPIQQMVAAARSIDSRRLSQRVDVPTTGDEVQQLAETFNGMLDRIELGFLRMREFTADASHELRTPIAVVRTAAEVGLLRRNATPEFYRETLERILRESERNTALLANLLELSRMDSGVDAGERLPLDLHCSLAEACDRIAPLAMTRGVELRCLPAASPAEIIADRDQLRRLWLILLDNAIKFTASGGSVTAGVRRGAVEVADTGTGIAPEHQDRIFERFYRADKARSRSLGGAGLGLAIANEIVRRHGAEIRVRSRLGSGSVFTVTFPAASVIKDQTSEESQVPLTSL